MQRCGWAIESDPLYLAYHDEEWGVPSRDDRHLFELIVLEGAQASASSARPSATPSCRRRAWSTTTSRVASGTASWPICEPAHRALAPKSRRSPGLARA